MTARGKTTTGTNAGSFKAAERAEAGVALTYFHGTTASLEPGDELVPGAELDKRNFGTDFNAHGGGNDHVYLTADMLSAYDWGVQAAKGRKKQVRVYQVEAHATPTTRYDEYVAPRARVVRDVTNG